MKSVPSLVINEHDRFTAEMRDKVLAKLHKSMQTARAPAYRMLTPHRLHQLAQFEASEGGSDQPLLATNPRSAPARRVAHCIQGFGHSNAGICH
jgi:hypothetical protein